MSDSEICFCLLLPSCSSYKLDFHILLLVVAFNYISIYIYIYVQQCTFRFRLHIDIIHSCAYLFVY